MPLIRSDRPSLPPLRTSGAPAAALPQCAAPSGCQRATKLRGRDPADPGSMIASFRRGISPRPRGPSTTRSSAQASGSCPRRRVNLQLLAPNQRRALRVRFFEQNRFVASRAWRSRCPDGRFALRLHPVRGRPAPAPSNRASLHVRTAPCSERSALESTLTPRRVEKGACAESALADALVCQAPWLESVPRPRSEMSEEI